ncbi:SDR family oxidoreductase [Microbacterium sp. X-17]|uniref:SDR family NAD(P)-dependent oxidoreductase n=1 Tax=Microbacterium sp. X-17 TaxID=3144404 RepID=UPI0031F4AFEF
MGILSGCSAIIVGASSGLGYGTALRFAEEGANVLVAARRVDRLEALVEEARSRALEGRIVARKCDVEKEADLDAVVANAIEEFGAVHILFASAQGGLEGGANLSQATAEGALFSYRSGPLYTMLLMQKLLPYFKAQNYGRIITTASGAAIHATPGFAVYGMSKAAMMALTRTAASEWGRFGITTNCIFPVTWNDHFGEGTEGTSSVEMIAKVSPVGYMGQPYENASPILAFIASEGAHYLNGQMIGVDGGMSPLA